MTRMARSISLLAVLLGVPVAASIAIAQVPAGKPMAPPALPTLSPEAAAAMDELSQRFGGETALIQGWFRDRTVLYYDFGAVAAGVAAGRVVWPIHGFDAKGNPVAIRGQRPIFSTIPGLSDYSGGVWRLVYLVTADKAQPNDIRDMASIEAAIHARRAALRETETMVNLPIVPRGTTLARDTTQAMVGWYQGREVHFFDFGEAKLTPAPMWRFAHGKDAAGEPNVLAAQNSIVDSIPVAPAYPDIWEISLVEVDSAYASNSLKSAEAVRAAKLPVANPSSIRNLPIAIIDGAPIQRVSGPIRAFSDMRSPFPPKPTILAVPTPPASQTPPTSP